jgi:hypothetical protein
MNRLGGKLAIISVACVLACALASSAQQPAPEAATTENQRQTDGSPSFLLTPPPAPIAPIIAPIIFDPPVPYFSQTGPIDNPTAFDPRLELASDEVKLGWNVLVELDYVKPFIHNGLNSGDLLAGSLPDPVTVPTARPDWTAMPRIDLSYRFESGLGEIHAIFRTLNVQTTAVAPNFDAAGAGTLVSHLNLNVLDIDNAYTEFNPGRIGWLNPLLLVPGRLGLNLRPEEDPNPTFRMKWAYGVRIANVFFDSRGTGNQILSERVTNTFMGAGPRMSVDFFKPFARRPALGAYARFELSGLFGDITQSFAQTEFLPGGGIATGAGRMRDINTGVPVFEMETGLSYMPPRGPCWLRFTGGYRFEQWWYLGQTSTSNAGLTLQGIFLRGEWGY